MTDSRRGAARVGGVRLPTRRGDLYSMHMHPLRQWTAADLLDMPDDGQRYEVIDGELFVTPAPSLDHQAALGALYARLSEYLNRERVGYLFFSPADITFSPRRAVQPDLFVAPPVGDHRPRSYSEITRLMLAIEALSPSTARLDRIVKRNLYREERVAEFWIVDLDARAFERSTPLDSGSKSWTHRWSGGLRVRLRPSGSMSRRISRRYWIRERLALASVLSRWNCGGKSRSSRSRSSLQDDSGRAATLGSVDNFIAKGLP